MDYAPAEYYHPPVTMGFVEGLLGLGGAVASYFMGESAEEERARREAEARKEEYLRQREAATLAYEHERTMAELARQAAMEASKEQTRQQRAASIQTSQMIQTVAIGGAILLGVVGLGMIMKGKKKEA